MENNYTTVDSDMANSGNGMDNDVNNSLQSAAKWGKFLAITGFVGIGIIVVMAIFAGSLLTAFMQNAQGFSESGVIGSGAITFFYLALAAIYFFPVLFLYNFSTKTLSSIKRNDIYEMRTAAHNLKKLFQYMGIMTIILLSLYAFILLFAVVMAISTAF